MLKEVFLPFSPDVSEFLYRDVYPVTERKLRRHFRQRCRNEQEFDEAHNDVYNYLKDHVVASEQRIIDSGEEKGNELKELRLVSKMEKLKKILFEEDDDEIIDENETVPLYAYMEMKESLENLLLEARDEIVQLKEARRERSNDSEIPPNVDSEEPESNVDSDYSNINSVLNELAILREVRRRHYVEEEGEGEGEGGYIWQVMIFWQWWRYS